jgi:RNA polymerase sigma-70 factor (ECF subfamily)
MNAITAIPAALSPALSLEEAIAHYQHGLIKYCYSLLGNYHDAQDAMQETFAKAYAKSNSFRGESNIVTWLYRIAHNTCLGMLRKRRFAFLPWGKETEKEASTAPGMPDPFLNETLTKALSCLSPKDRALVYARAVEDISYEELAVIHSTRAAALRKRYERARAKLKKVLQSQGYE